MEPAAGQYWSARVNIDPTLNLEQITEHIREGTTLLITRIASLVNGDAHHVVLASHPNHDFDEGVPSNSSYIMLPMFMELFKYEHDSEELRQNEIDETLHRLHLIQEELREGPPNNQDLRLSHKPEINKGANDSRVLATEEGVESIQQLQVAMEDQVKAISTWTTERLQQITQVSGVLSAFYNEKAQALVARVDTQKKSINKILRTVEGLNTYVGKEVEVFQITSEDKQPADRHEPITFYQDLLCLDEEVAMHADGAQFDHRSHSTLQDALSDPSFRDRLIPAKRGAVLFKFYHGKREAPQSKEPAQWFANILRQNDLDQYNNRIRLLYRDGDRFYWIDTPAISEITQILPSQGEQSEYFHRSISSWDFSSKDPIKARLSRACKHSSYKGEHNEQPFDSVIRPEHLDYAAAEAEQFNTLDSYSKVLIALWGLHDRTDLFDTTDIPKFSSWLNSETQVRYFNLVSQDYQLGEERETYSAFQARHNEQMRPGSLVVINLNDAITEDTCPAMYGPEVWRDRNRSIKATYLKSEYPDGLFIGLVVRNKGKLSIKVRAEKQAYKAKQPVFSTRVEISKHDGLILDNVDATDLTYYLTSRQQRRSYKRYLKIFKKAREYCYLRDTKEAWARAFLMDTATRIKGLELAPSVLQPKITEAVSSIRVSHNLEFLTQDFSNTAKSQLLAAFRLLVRGNSTLIKAVEQHYPDALRLVAKNGTQYALYSKPVDEHINTLYSACPDWVTRHDLKFDLNHVPTLSNPKPFYLEQRADEIILKDWGDQSQYTKPLLPAITPQTLLQSTTIPDKHLHLVLNPILWIRENWPSIKSSISKDSKKTVVSRQVKIILANIDHITQTYGGTYEATPKFVVLSMDALMFCATDPETRPDVEKFINCIYSYPDSKLSDITHPIANISTIPVIQASSIKRNLLVDAEMSSMCWSQGIATDKTRSPKDDKQRLHQGVGWEKSLALELELVLQKPVWSYNRKDVAKGLQERLSHSVTYVPTILQTTYPDIAATLIANMNEPKTVEVTPDE